ncbi:hypothetical protein LOTGIDRAFT_158775 [Lottia gigantea]|uniref:G-protein coupled receptors family 2 profile 2 domain-containing protein n=1 Tax=Lottia gigantea TaxID=225164 RepID=V4AV55_LOTGI|nr:hypothetical protein LOTGIDRAFT_158775 [Lottia gigantea]ESO98825.1 hypothetical protein LOTGIDRAFT_158775 [Lottia gigantea]
MMVVSLVIMIWFIATRQATTDAFYRGNVSDSIEYSLPFEEAAIFHDDFLSQANYIYKLYCQQSCQQVDITMNNKYCKYCFCDSTCSYYGDCCPDYPYINQSKLMPHSCLPTQFPFRGKYFKIVGFCPENHEDNRMVERCKKTFVYNWKSIQPVSDQDTGLTYKNRYCASCNGVRGSRVVPWEIGAKCDGVTPELDVLDSKQQVYISILTTEDCNVVFVKPDNISYRPCSTNDYILPRQCNSTGMSSIEDPLVEKGCLTFQENIVRFYPNVFCYICNSFLTWEEIKDNIVGHDSNVFRLALSALLDLDGSDDYEDDKVNSMKSCPFTDPYTCQCRNISCVEGKKFEDGQCVSVFKLTNTYRYNVCFHVQLNFNSSVNSPNDTFLEKFVQNMASLDATFDCNLYTDYLSECGPNITLKFLMKCTLYFRNPINIDVFEKAILLMTENKLNLTVDYPGIEIYLTDKCKRVSGALYINNDLTVPCSKYLTANILITQYNFTFDRNMKSQTTSLILTKTFLCPKIILNEDEVVVSPTNDSLLILATNETIEAFQDVSDDEESGYLVCVDDYLHSQLDMLNCDTEPPTVSITPRYSTLGIVSGVCTCISVIFLVITLVIFRCVKSLRTTIGIGIIALSVSLVIAQLLFEFGAEQTETSWVCQTLGILTHFFWLASTFWMNVCTLILFYKLNFPVESRNLSTRLLLIASNLYCWGSSGLIVTILVMSSYYTDNSYGYGGTSCYITSINGRRYGFALPVGLLVLINILLFSSTFIKLKMNEKLQSNQESQISMLGCLKLSVITGLTWIFAFAFEATGNVSFAYLFTIFVGSQGVVIFLTFVGNKRVFRMLKASFKSSSEHYIQSRRESSNVENRNKSVNLKSNPETEEFDEKKKLGQK